jgi:serine/threonine-protein kinase
MSASQTSKLAEGTVLGEKFAIVGVLGEGGTGVVYDAKRISDDKPIALKVIHRELAGDRQIRGRFVREAAVLRMLEGKNVCPVLESGEIKNEGAAETEPPLLYLALPKIEGRSLASRLAHDGPMSVDEAVRLVSSILNALATAHARGIIHRDLKTQNVLLRADAKDSKDDEVVVVDFGMSKIVRGAATGTTDLTAHNMVFGTPEYMSPEQARGDEVDTRCDLYACGVILYELVTGTVPFSGTTPLIVLTRHLTDPVEAPRVRAKDRAITPAIEAVILHALAKKPDDRYPTAEVMRAAIVHAKGAPDDVASVHPSRFTGEEEPDAHARTMPAISQKHESTRPPSVRVNHRDGPPSSVKIAVAEAPRSKSGIVVWVVLAVLSIGLGVYLALRK